MRGNNGDATSHWLISNHPEPVQVILRMPRLSGGDQPRSFDFDPSLALDRAQRMAWDKPPQTGLGFLVARGGAAVRSPFARTCSQLS